MIHQNYIDAWRKIAPWQDNAQVEQDLINRYYHYMRFVVKTPPSKKEFLMNMDAKLLDEEFLGDTKGLLRREEDYDPQMAYKLVRSKLIEKI